jgi:hypothetical protein
MTETELLEKAVQDSIEADNLDDHEIPDHGLFILAQNLKSVKPNMTPDEIQLWTQKFYDNGGKDGYCLGFENMYITVLSLWDRVKFPKDALPRAIARADNHTEPRPEVAQFSKGVQRLAGVCYELQQVAGPHAFPMSATIAGEIAGVNRKTAWTYLQMFIKLGFLELVKQGTCRGIRTGPKKDLASEYRYLDKSKGEEVHHTVSQIPKYPSNTVTQSPSIPVFQDSQETQCSFEQDCK